MVIKKTAKKQVQIETVNSKILVRFEEGRVEAKLDLSGKSVEVSKPGEYEYQGIQITAVEITKDHYEGKVNLLVIELEEMRLGFITQEISMEKELYKDLSNLDILVLNSADSIEVIKKALNYFEAIALIVLEAANPEEVKTSLGLVSISSEKSIKLKSGDIKRSEDEQKVVGYILG